MSKYAFSQKTSQAAVFVCASIRQLAMLRSLPVPWSTFSWKTIGSFSSFQRKWSIHLSPIGNSPPNSVWEYSPALLGRSSTYLGWSLRNSRLAFTTSVSTGKAHLTNWHIFVFAKNYFYPLANVASNWHWNKHLYPCSSSHLWLFPLQSMDDKSFLGENRWTQTLCAHWEAQVKLQNFQTHSQASSTHQRAILLFDCCPWSDCFHFSFR